MIPPCTQHMFYSMKIHDFDMLRRLILVNPLSFALNIVIKVQLCDIEIFLKTGNFLSLIGIILR